MFSIEKRQTPADSLLGKLSTTGTYTDCYTTVVLGQVTFPQFITAFYTTPLFRLERLILKLFVSKPSTDADVRQLADGEIEKFAVWHVENRSENEILMCDFLGRTRSWLMIVSVTATQTRLYFGSAVVPRLNLKGGELSLGIIFKALLGFHQIYSIFLLYFATLSIKRQLLRAR